MRRLLVLAALGLALAYLAGAWIATDQVIGEQPRLRRLPVRPRDLGLAAEEVR
ncbi:MAG: hypothetical protein HZC42_08520, partial [Candidatus Eisenbacteria bacterium]|nr:hypothetical protein [Candidatus Eisenbacteria bacterium]